jgi:phosphatidylinositol-3-phosphatase
VARRARVVGAPLAVALLALGCVAFCSARADGATAPCRGSAAPVWHHVVWLWLENRAYGEIVGAPEAPYLNELARRCGLATDYQAVAHPSLPNYIAATSGSTHGVADDAGPSAHPIDGPSLFEQARGVSLLESMPGSCRTSDAYPYAVSHNPEPYYTRIANTCLERDRPYTGSTGSAPFTLVVPNLCSDMHSCSTRTGDLWLKRFIATFTARAPWTSGDTALFVTFDEADSSSSNRVATIVVAPSVRPGTRVSTPFDHYSLLLTTEEMLGHRCLGHACSARSMLSAFHLGQRR